jgi:hypothetical protein
LGGGGCREAVGSAYRQGEVGHGGLPEGEARVPIPTALGTCTRQWQEEGHWDGKGACDGRVEVPKGLVVRGAGASKAFGGGARAEEQ